MRKHVLFFLCLALLLGLAGCGSGSQDVASVQSVASITGVGYIGMNSRFAGVVAPQSETTITKDPNRVLEEVKVAAGDSVTKGQVLFTYDTDAMQISLEKAQLEVEQTQGTITSLETQKAQLEQSRANAPASDQLSFTLEIKDIETQLLEAQYNLSLKQSELEKLQNSMDEGEVTSPVDGVVQSVKNEGDNSGDGYYTPEGDTGSAQAFITIVETGTFKIKGTINESNRSALDVGVPVLVRSRTDESVWHGTITNIDWDSPIQKENDYYGSSSDPMTTSSSYPFYIELEEDEGLLLGQHVYIELDAGQDSVSGSICLPSYYLNEIDEANLSAWVWAADKRGRLERRTVQLAEYLADQDSWIVTVGLTPEDLIALSDDALEEGMRTEEYDPNAFYDEETPLDMEPYDGDMEMPEADGSMEAVG